MSTVIKNDVKIVKFGAMTLRKVLDDDTKDTATLSWSTRGGYPRITIFTSSNNTKPDGKFDYNRLITAAFDYVTLNIVYGRLQEVIDSDKEVKYNIGCYNAGYDNGVKTGNVVLQSTLTIGKDPEGLIYLAAVEDGKRKIKFDILPGAWHKLYDDNGSEITDKRVLSKLYAPAYLRTLKKLMDSELVKDMIKSSGDVQTKAVEDYSLINDNF